MCLHRVSRPVTIDNRPTDGGIDMMILSCVDMLSCIDMFHGMLPPGATTHVTPHEEENKQ